MDPAPGLPLRRSVPAIYTVRVSAIEIEHPTGGSRGIGRTRVRGRIRSVIAHPLTQIVLIVAGFLPVRIVLTRWPARLPEDAYAQPMLFLEALMSRRAALALLLAVGVGVALQWRRLSWRDEDLGKLRIVAASSAIILAWSYALYPFNHYLGQAHLLDRGLVIGLAALVVVHPAFVPLFLWMLVVIVGQFQGPLHYSWTDIDLVVDVLALLVAALGFRALALVRAQGIVLALLVLVGAHYVDAARVKYALSPRGWEWAFHNDIANLFVSSHLNGWLADLSEPTVLAIAWLVSAVAVPLQVLTWALEGAPLAILASRPLAIGLLLGLIGLHVGILVSSGIFFWKWAVVDAALALVLWRGDAGWFSSRATAVAVAPMILLGGLTGIGNNLGWWDSRLSQYHQLWAVTASGERWRIDEQFFGPYDKPIAQDRFFYLHSEPELTQTLGGTHRYRDFMAIQRVDNKDDLRAMIARGAVRRNESRAKRFDHFVRSFLSSHARRGEDLVPRLLAIVSTPMHISHRARAAQRLPRGANVERVEVMFREVWYDGAQLHLLREVKVRDIPMASSSPAAKD